MVQRKNFGISGRVKTVKFANSGNVQRQSLYNYKRICSMKQNEG